MGKPKPDWKDQFVDREYLKAALEEGFRRMATGDFDQELGRVTNLVEQHVVLKVIEGSKLVLEMVNGTVTDALKTLGEWESQIGRDQIRRVSDIRKEEED